MIEVGDKVRIGESGAVVFAVREVDPDEQRAVIEADMPDSPGRYPFSMPVSALAPAALDR